MTRKGPDALPLLERELTGRIIGAYYECYNELGFGFLESVYRRALAIELRARGIRVAEEASVEVAYKGVVVGAYRIDLLVENRVVVEIKASSVLGPTDRQQLLNYLRATELHVGLLLHFGPEPSFFRFVSERTGRRPRPAQGADPAVSA
ncbi:MAG: GxxExxY protein [bacterium]